MNTAGTRLHHLALGARDVDRLAAFYRDVLSLPEIARHRRDDGSLRSIWLDLGGAILMIEHTDEPLGHDKNVGLFLIALRVTPEELATVEQRLERAGAVIEKRTAWTSYSRDPEGNRVAVSHHRPGDRGVPGM